MITILVSFLAVLNPFALFIYLEPVMKDLSNRDFRYVLFKASLISFLIYVFFAFSGIFIFERVFNINFESFRIFGGIILLSFGYIFIIKGQKALITIKEDLNDLASEIALPFMVGAATISIAIILGNSLGFMMAFVGIFVIMFINYFIVLFLKFFRQSIEKKKFRIAFDKNMGIVLRLNAFFVGSIGVDMIISGINNLYF